VPITSDDDTRGIVGAAAGFEHFELTRIPPRPDLAWAVDRYWIVRWDLRGRAPYDQRVIPHPLVHLVFEEGVARVYGISSEEFVRHLDGHDQVLGVKFRPAGFRPFLGRAVATIADQVIPATELWGDTVTPVARRLGGLDDLRSPEAIGLVERFLDALDVDPLPMTRTVNAIVAHIVSDPSVTRVDQLASRLEVSTRRLQRLFAEHVGLGPKWVINRCRVHRAAEAASRTEVVDWAGLAAELGYSDQAHLIRDFAAAVGTSPERYARRERRGEL
jgi:AraC-like DNA-binding protein